MYRLLGDHGQATASMPARKTDESTGQTSYHLRQLEKFGFVEEVPGAGSARERWWRAVSFSYAEPGSDDQFAESLVRWMVDSESSTMLAVARGWHAEQEQWRDASTITASSAWLTASELSELTDDLLAVLDRHTSDAEAQRREAGSVSQHEPRRPDERRVRIYLNAVPLPVTE